jgi:Na+/proline symporter
MYLQMVMGYFLGYFVIAEILLPLYYKLNLTSIYTYLDVRFGVTAYKTGASFFLISRIIGASFRLFLVANVLQIAIFDHWNIPFYVSVVITIVLIWLYTYKGGIKTIIWTDFMQTTFMLAAVVITIILIAKHFGTDLSGLVTLIEESNYSRTFNFSDWQADTHFIKQFLSGAFITIVMTGLDQDMMQKNLSCRNLKDAKKNMYMYGFAFIPVNILFLSLGALLFIYARDIGLTLPEQGDDLYPMIATQGYLGIWAGFFFILGLIAAAYSSADSALTALTTSVTVDILNTKDMAEKKLKTIRKAVHIIISSILFIVIVIFKQINDESVISSLFKAAGYTYGPLLGLYSFGLFNRRNVSRIAIPVICIMSPVLSYIINYYSVDILWGYRFGFEILLVNGLITFTGLWMFSYKNKDK